MRHFRALLLLLGLLAMWTAALQVETPLAAELAAEGESADTTAEAADKPFRPTDDVMADVDAAIARAGEAGKLTLIVMGANWCHDTMGLLRHFADTELAATMDSEYETLLVDVDHLDANMEVIRRFGMPVIYATPTVLIIDPETGQLINRSNMHQWRDADSISIKEARAYFADMAKPEARMIEDENASPALDTLYAEIDAFEAVQAQRIYGGFAALKPLLAAYEKDEDNPPENFEDYWMQLRGLRYAITGDLAALRVEARQRVAAGEADIALEYPVYEAFTWEGQK